MLGFAIVGIQAQENNAFENGNVVSDELTKDPEQNAKWRMGQANYSAKPKDAWELGVHFGHLLIAADVDSALPGGYGLGLHLRKAVHYAFSIRADFFYGKATGLEAQPSTHSSLGGGLVQSTFSAYNPANGLTDGTWFPSYETTAAYGAIQGVLNIGNILFHKDRNKWNWYVTGGAGFANYTTNLDLLDASGAPYNNLRQASGFTPELFDTKSGRSDIKSALEGIYDGDYETEGPRKKGVFSLGGDDSNINVVLTASMGISRRFSKRFNIGLEHQIMHSGNDFLDGINSRSAVDQTNSSDIMHYTNIRLAFNLGSMDKRTEPLYWLNPLDAAFNDIAELKRRPILDLTDEDGDGVIDMLDQELGSPGGYAVDTRGVTLDSDRDGYADGKDKEIFSPPGFEVDSDGVAIVPTYMSETDVNRIVDAKTAAMAVTINDMASKNCGKWFLPMLHFSSDKYDIKPEYYGHLHHVANVMQMCPNTCVSAVGHTDIRSGNDYNRVLSYNRAKSAVDYLVTNYGIDRSRFNLMYGGEEAPLSVSGNASNLMNRRVEFRVCKEGDSDMERPEGPNAGSGGSRSGSTYSGNKNSGY